MKCLMGAPSSAGTSLLHVSPKMARSSILGTVQPVRPLRAVSALPQRQGGASYNDTVDAPMVPQRVFMFDPANPSSVEEIMVQPHEDTAAAEELLAVAHEQAKAAEAAAGGPRPGQPPLKRTPIPLRAVSPMPSRRNTTGSGRLASPIPQQTQGMVHSNRQVPSLNNRSAEMQKQLVAQLEKEQSQVSHLQQYEVMYREWRMKAERLDSDIGLLQRLVAEKDAELAHGYKLLEASAAERSRLRHSFQASQEKAKQLQHQVTEAQARAALSAGSSPAMLGSGGQDGYANGHSNGNGRGRGSSSLTISGVQGLIEELSVMAKGMAYDMSNEIASVQKSPKPE